MKGPVIIHEESGRSAAWQRTCFGSRGSAVQIRPPRPQKGVPVWRILGPWPKLCGMSGEVALYRKWRPQRFAEVVGQELVVETLKRAVAQGKLSHAYLFAGQRGVGKTTVARILARAANCLSPEEGEPCNKCENCRRILSGRSLDMVEIDGASNRGIDQIRRLREEVNYVPAGARYKVYIIDEVHMLTNEAFNALLKTLEEPPPHVIFIFATTEPHKVPTTILSRCQIFEFRPIPEELIKGKLLEIAVAEGIPLEESAAALIARRASGSLRDAEVLLEQLAQGGPVTEERVVELLGLPPREELDRFLDALAGKRAAPALETVEGLWARGRDLGLFLEEAVRRARDRIIAGEGELVDVARRLIGWRTELPRSASPRIHLELEILAACGPPGPQGGAVSQGTSEGKTRGEKGGEAAEEMVEAPVPTGDPGDEGGEVGSQEALPLEREIAPQRSPKALVPPPDAFSDPWEKLLADILGEKVSVAVFLRPAEHSFQDGVLRIVLPEGYRFHYDSLREPGVWAYIEEKARRYFQPLLSVQLEYRGGEEKRMSLEEGARLVAEIFQGEIVKESG